MKKVKFIVSFFVLLLCFILTGELYQNYFTSFTGSNYYFDVSWNDLEGRKKICSLLENLSAERNSDVFCVERTTDTVLSSTITVFVTEKSANLLKNDYGIAPGTYPSFFSGTTTVVFSDFVNVSDDTNTIRYYFTGNIDVVRDIRNVFYSHYPASYVHKGEGGTNLLFTSVWILSGLFILLLTWFDIQFQKKENFILISLGGSKWRIIKKNILIETLFFFGIYVFTRVILSRYTYLNYMQNTALLIFIAITVGNAMLYMALLKYDFKQVLYSANINNATLTNCYIFKALTMILAVAVLSSNLIIIVENCKYLLQYKNIEKFKDYSYLSLCSTVKDNDATHDEAMNLIFYDCYKDDKVAFSVSNLDSDNPGELYLLIDKNAISLLPQIQELNNIDFTKDYYILLPSDCEEAEPVVENAVNSVEVTFPELSEKTKYDVITYSGNSNVVYFNTSVSATAFTDFDTFKNPVIVLCCFSDAVLPKIVSNDYSALGHIFQDIMFKVSKQDLKDINDKYQLENNGLRLTSINVLERSEQYKAVMMRIVLLNTVISIFFLLLELAMISTVVKLEYSVNAVELSIKKILGFSLYQRNRVLFLLNTFSAFIGIITVIIASLMLRFSKWYIVLIVGIILIMLECFVLTYNAAKLEQTNIPKILKGGSL